ncbi:glycoside hydrolase family 99-like domain-containing protein [Flavobacterium sp. B17]|uniref:glycoside hydrolase family 99-like domain-containing protein n=1 Tax=Flavobacterium sp. B17 TaxID=95618 RepID=UPI00034823F0|nr:glycoside hydrolase family 99-like domain-containing protein [Flavobacterium sp. B17]
MNNKKARVIAFYLPQFHPVPENNEWWGPGFTEWHSVANAKPLYKGHHQPNIPADLGFYDLRVAETRKLQAEMAKEAGVEGFCYWHYWFGDGKRLLEKPINEVLASGEPDFPFCFGWANHNWYQKLWDPSGSGDKLLIEQKYLGREDYEEHFMTALLPAFKDKRYIQVDGKPLFVIYSIDNKEKIKEIIDVWRELALRNGLEGIYFVAVQRGETKEEVKSLGFDAMYRLQDYLKTYVNQPYLCQVWQF